VRLNIYQVKQIDNYLPCLADIGKHGNWHVFFTSCSNRYFLSQNGHCYAYVRNLVHQFCFSFLFFFWWQ